MSLGEQEGRRLRWLRAGFLAALGLLLLALWNIQVGHGEQYADNLERQSLRRVRIPGVRGRILDRRGVCLADNRPNYGIALYLEELRNAQGRRVGASGIWQAVASVSAVLGQPPQIDPSRIADHLYSQKALPLIAWRNLGPPALARLAESGARLPGVDIVVEADRVYPEGPLLAHTLGYVGVADLAEEEDDLYHYYLPDLAGRTGLERHWDATLAGRPGGRLVRVDVAGFKHDETALREPVPGGDLQLAVDARIQREAEAALEDAAGAAVVVDPRNGDVLALASAPGFDPNAFSPRIGRAEWARLTGNPLKPLFPRALAGLYAPGSIFKPLVALAALGQGVSPEFAVDCPGYFELGNRRFACYLNTAHGHVGFRRSLCVSCNTFYYQAGLACGYDALVALAEAAGLGRKTGIDTGGEAAGLLPSRAWKRRVQGEAWRDGDTCNVAVGQGALLVTPLQMAMLAAALANGGTLYRPRLVLAVRDGPRAAFRPVPPAAVRRLPWSAAHLALVRTGLQDVIHAMDGSGRLARLDGIRMAGKTGTAEYGRKGEGRKHGWMIAYAPADAPRYAVAIVLDDAVSGGLSVAPRVGGLMRRVFELEAGGS